MRWFALVGFSVALAFPANVSAQVTRADYERADALRNSRRGTVFKSEIHPNWFPRSNGLWYRNDLPGGKREYVLVDTVKGIRRPAFDHVKLAEMLTKSNGKPHAPDRLEVEKLDLEEGGALRFQADGKFWRLDPESDTFSVSKADLATVATPSQPVRKQKSERSSRSPVLRRSVAVNDHNIVLTDETTGSAKIVTTEGTESDGYEPGVYWSPDASRFVALRTAKGDDRRVHLIVSSPRDQLQPKLDSYHYLKPGDRVPITKPHLFDALTGREIAVADDLFKNPWSIEEFQWAADSSKFSFLYNERGHQILRVVSVDAKTGAASTAVEDRSKTFIDYSNKTFLEWLDGDRELLWMSERDGWNHLYRIDATTGQVVNQVTKGEWVVCAVDRVDHLKKRILVPRPGNSTRARPVLRPLLRASTSTAPGSSY